NQFSVQQFGVDGWAAFAKQGANPVVGAEQSNRGSQIEAAGAAQPHDFYRGRSAGRAQPFFAVRGGENPWLDAGGMEDAERQVHFARAGEHDYLQLAEMKGFVAIPSQIFVVYGVVPTLGVGARLFAEGAGAHQHRVMMRAEKIHQPAVLRASRDFPAASLPRPLAEGDSAIEAHHEIRGDIWAAGIGGFRKAEGAIGLADFGGQRGDIVADVVAGAEG